MNKYFQLILIIVITLLLWDILLNNSSFSSKVQYPCSPKEYPNNAKLDKLIAEIETKTERPTTPDYKIDGVDRFHWYLKKTAETVLQNAPNISTLYAYEFEHEISVTLTSWKMIRVRVYCRYLDKEDKEIGDPYESFTYPEYIVNCPKREGTRKIGLSVSKKGEFVPLPIIDRMSKELKYELSMCVATIYGDEPKWLLFIEMIEHFKLQGVQHFYIHIHNASNYDLKVINDYVRTGEVEIHYLIERDQRTDNHWHMVNIADCLIWSRGDSKWTIFADLDERIIMTNYTGTILDYVRDIKNESIAGIQFRQQWVLKTELMPEKYINDRQIDSWMPTHRFHNSSGIGAVGHTAKCIIDSSKVFIMWVHSVTEFFPGKGYELYKLTPEEGLVRHYRDQSLGEWGRKWLNSTLKFGPLRKTDYPAKYLGKLTENVKRRAKYVYGNKFD
uniref:Glycosyltransferase family 92 protein n=2 Tax=Caenorhabditis tropicalis TaxID=1561998 RepID=A0A1I7U6B9_9PELO